MDRRRLVPALALAAVLAAAGLTACAPDGAGPNPSGSASSSRSASASASPAPSASGTPSTSPTVNPAACLAGNWTMDQASVQGFYDDVNGLLAGAGVAFTPQGTAALALAADGTFTWSPAVQVSAEVSGTTVLIALGGQITGTYTATADRIATTTQSTDGLTVSATIDGAETDAGSITEQIAGAPITDASYTCAGDTLTLDTALAGGTATSVLRRG